MPRDAGSGCGARAAGVRAKRLLEDRAVPRRPERKERRRCVRPPPQIHPGHRRARRRRLMAVRIVRLGTPRQSAEGLRIGTVRRPPRGVPKSEYASRNYYDVWYPNLAPGDATMKLGHAAQTPAQWNAFVRAYRREM